MFQFRKRAKQLIDFSGIQKTCGVTPTDVDAEIDYYGKAWIFIEFKHNDAPLSVGQKIAFERKVDDITASKKDVLCIVAEHYVDNPNDDVDAAKCVVREFYWKGKWRTCRRDPPILLYQAIQKFISKVEERK